MILKQPAVVCHKKEHNGRAKERHYGLRKLQRGFLGLMLFLLGVILFGWLLFQPVQQAEEQAEKWAVFQGAA